MKRVRAAAVLTLALLLVAVLFDWTVSAFGPFGIGGLDDMRRLRAVSVADGRVVQRLASNVDEPFERGAFRLRTDARGTRVGASALEVPDGARRVVFVGGGATLGWGVDAAATFVARFERTWNEAGETPSIRALNAGHVGFRLGQTDPAVLERLQADAMVVCGPVVGDGLEPSLADALSGVDGGGSVVMPAVADVRRRLADRPTVAAVDPDAASRALEALVAACRARGVPLRFVDLGEGTLARLGAALGVPVVQAAFAADELRAPVFADPRHGYPNPLGHEMIAKRVFEGLRASLF